MTHFGRSSYIAWGTHVLDVVDITQMPTMRTDAIEITRYGSSVREYAPGYTDYGSIGLTVSTTNSGVYRDLRQAAADRIVGTLAIITPHGEQITYTGFITERGLEMNKFGEYLVSLQFKLSSAPQITEFAEYHIFPLSGTTMYRGFTYGLSLSAGNDPSAHISAVFKIDTEGLAPETRIEGNTLIIGEAQNPGIINVSATIAPMGQIKQVGTVTYHILASKPTVFDLEEIGTIAIPRGGAEATIQINKQSELVTYPTGADKTATYTLTSMTTNASVTVDANGIGVNANTGLITIEGFYAKPEPGQAPGSKHDRNEKYEYKLVATSTAVLGMKSSIVITIVSET